MIFKEESVEIIDEEGKAFTYSAFGKKEKREKTFQLQKYLWGGDLQEHCDTMSGSVQEDHGGSTMDSVNTASCPIEVLPQDTEKNLELKKEHAQELLKVIYPVSLERYMEIFVYDDAPFGIPIWGKLKGDTNIECTNWEEHEELSHTRELNFVTKVKDVPFKSRVRIRKIQSYKYENNELIMKSQNHTFDLPFCNAFHVEDLIRIVPHEDNPEKCFLTQTIKIVFSRSVLLESTIVRKTFEDFQNDINQHINEIKKRRIQESKNNSELTATLLHEIEEVNAPMEFRKTLKMIEDEDGKTFIDKIFIQRWISEFIMAIQSHVMLKKIAEKSTNSDKINVQHHNMGVIQNTQLLFGIFLVVYVLFFK